MLVERKTIELEREYMDEIRKTVTAFANSDGGKIYIGIDDHGTVYGVSDIDGVLLKISNIIRDTIRPDVTLFTDINIEQVIGTNIIVVLVHRGTSRPYYLANKGIRPEGVFVRQGASTVPASDTVILYMIKETSGDHFESARSLIQQLTFHDTFAYF